MKRLISLFSMFLIFVFAGSSYAETAVTVYADDGYAPYSYKEGAEAKGIYNEILKAVFAKMPDYKVTIEPVPWKRALKYMETGEGFAISPPYLRPKERPFINPYSVPIFEEEVVVFCREEILKTPRPNWPKDYYDLKVARNAGFASGGDEFMQAVKDGKIKLDEAKTNRENILKLLEGHTDAYINDRLSILQSLKAVQAEKDKYKNVKILEGTLVSTEKAYLGFTSMDKGKFAFKDDFVKKFNAAIEDMKAKGEIKAIADKFLESGK